MTPAAYARCLGIPIAPDHFQPDDDEGFPLSFGWDGRTLHLGTDIAIAWHEIAHWLLATPASRRRADFGGVRGTPDEALVVALGITLQATIGRDREGAILAAEALGEASVDAAMARVRRGRRG